MCFLFRLFLTKHISFAQNICSLDWGQAMTTIIKRPMYSDITFDLVYYFAYPIFISYCCIST